MDHPIIIPIVLQFVGVAIIMAEVLIPSGGLLAILAIVLFGYSLFSVFTGISTQMGVGFVLADLVIIPVTVYFAFKALAKSPVTLRKRLSSELGVSVQDKDLEQHIGKEGIAVTDLRPSGMAMIANERIDVVTEGNYLAKDSPLIVVTVTGNQIIVKEN